MSEMTLPRRRLIEMLLLFFALPLLLAWLDVRRGIFVFLWLAMLGVCVAMQRQGGFSLRREWNAAAVTGAAWKHLALRFAAAAAALTALTWLLLPENLLGLPRRNPPLWAAIMLLYPLLSVLPQEILFRTFFFRRYGPLFSGTDRRRLIAFSGVSFGLAHAVMGNVLAVALSAIGGALLAETYARHRSLALVCLEHAFYGCFVFTIGLGWFFFSGAVR